MNIVAPIERTGSGYSAYVPDLPGRAAAAATRIAAQVLIEEAVRLHLGPMHKQAEPTPESATIASTDGA